MRSARETVADVAAGRQSAEAIAQAAVQRILEKNPELNAIVTFDPDLVIAEAREVDRRIASGERLPLAGLPVAIKDNIWVAGRRVTQGSRLFGGFKAPRDAIAVERLRRAGAVIAGLANTSEFACKGVTTNRLFGPTLHPHDRTLSPGGSSGGPAVAVAAGLVPVALGTDAGGSSRRAPAHVGVVGFKPSFGAIPYGPGFPEPFYGISTMAPIARNVGDISLMFEILRGPDVRDADTIQVNPPCDGAPERLRVAYSPRLGLARPIDIDAAAAVAKAVRRLSSAGISIREVDPIWPAGFDENTLMPLQWAGLAELYAEPWRRDPDLFDLDIGRQIERGLKLTGTDVAHSLAASAEIARCLSQFFGNFDILLCPTIPCVSWPSGELGPVRIEGVEVDSRAHAIFTPFFNHAKVPAISIPCGSGRGGLPLGLQICGARERDLAVLRFASFAESVLSAGEFFNPDKMNS
jgi:aspartyl-tRNA(Asn)/glutamyl-tRNA(Gln) amidotransferase subunit A